MSKILDCWDKIEAKGYRHRDGTRVLTAADKRAILADVDERIKSGDSALDAAKAAVQAQLAQVDAQMAGVFEQAGVSMSRPLTPEGDAEYLAAVERGDMESAQRMVDEAAYQSSFTTKGFHRSPKAFTRFIPGGPNAKVNPWVTKNGELRHLTGKSGKAIWFGPKGDKLPAYHNDPKGDGPIVEAWIKNPSPLVVDDDTRDWAKEVYGDGSREFPLLLSDEQIDKIREDGYTGVEYYKRGTKYPDADGLEEIVVFDPNQVKSADPVTRDDQGNVIPLSQRFNEASPDIRFSVPLELTGPTEPTGPTSQVMGREGTAQVTPGSIERARAPIREKFFDSTQPLSEDQTRKALDLMYAYMGKATGTALAAEVRSSVNPADQNLANGVLRSELDAYAQKLLAQGDPSLFDIMQRYATTDFVIGTKEDGTAITYRSVAQELAGNSRHPGSAVATARDMVNTEKRKANTKVFTEPEFEGLSKGVDTTTLGPAEVAAVGDTPLPSGETVRKKIDKLKRPRKPKDDPEIKDEEGKIAEAEKEAKAERAKGESLLDSLARTQSDTPPANRKRQDDEVRKVYREAITLNYSDDALRAWLEGRLAPLEVPDSIRAKLTEAIVRERTIRRAIKNSEEMILRRTKKLAEGEAGTLKGLEKALVEAPAALQRSPAWRRRIMLDYFKQAGLSDSQAKIAAKAYESLFAERLADATEQAVRKLLKSPDTPWSRKLQATRGPRKKAVSKEVEKLIKAVRLGLTDPNKFWDEEIARQNGWSGFTAKQHQRLTEIDRELLDETTLPNRRASLIHEVNGYITEAKQPPSIGNIALASYVASALGGLSTFTVQPSAHVGGIISVGTAMMADPLSALDIAKAFAQSAKTTATETEFAARTGAYRTEILDSLKGYEKPLEYLLNKGRENFKSTDPATRLKGVGQMLVGYQEYTMRALNSIDQGFITGAREMTAVMGTRDVLARLGMSREQLRQVIEEAMRAKADVYHTLTANGIPRHIANADATDIFMRNLYETVANREGTIDGMTMEEWAEDIQRGAELESEGRTGRVSQGISPTEEGMLRKVITYPLKGITEGLGQGGGLALYLRSVYGFMAIPFRTAAWYAGYSPYGFIRYGLHKAAEATGRANPYAQSYGSRVQVRQRLLEATAGTVAMGLLAALASATSDDDDTKPNALFVTGGGPGPNDAAYRDAWMKKFKPYSITLKIGGAYHSFNYGRLGESLGWAATLAGSLDDVAISKKNKESHGGELDKVDALFGNMIGNFAERSAFKGLYKVAETVGKAKQPGNTDRVSSQLSFAASSIIPWKSAMTTVQRIVSDPVDNDGVKASILASIPVAGPLVNKPRINVLGDPAGDLSAGGRAFSLGLVSFGSPDGGRAYDLILKHGRGPSSYQRNDFSKRFENNDNDVTYYDFSKLRGQKIKAALESNYERLKTVDAETFGEFLRRLTRQVNADTARELKLKQTTVE